MPSVDELLGFLRSEEIPPAEKNKKDNTEKCRNPNAYRKRFVGHAVGNPDVHRLNRPVACENKKHIILGLIKKIQSPVKIRVKPNNDIPPTLPLLVNEFSRKF